jgi:DNA-binding CsgD family transcriptional regulator/tetratricopeptide (TPR) repeat protein
VVLVSGSAGIGKSALLEEVCRQAERLRVRPVVASCDPMLQVTPGAPIVAALRAGREPLVTDDQYERIVASLGEPLLLVERIASALDSAAAAGPLLIAIDDVQWADGVSRFVIRALLSRLLGQPVVWLLASREFDTGLLGSIQARVDHISLAPLTTTDLAAIAQDRLGQVPDRRIRRFLEASAGNPLLATEVLDNLARAAARGERDTVPGEFGAAIAKKLADLPAAARELVAVVAVAGQKMALREAVLLLTGPGGSVGGGALAAAADSGLISVEDESLAPRHDLVREAVCAALPDEAVRTLHRRFAEYHLSAGRAPLAASHARAAATPGDIASALVLITAAEHLATVSPDDAGDLAALAFRTVRTEQPEWLEVGRRCLSVFCRTQRAGEAITVADVILAHVDDGDLVGAVESEAARALWLAGRLGELLARIEPVLASESLDPAVSARLTAARALANTRLLPGEKAAGEAARALESARATGDRDAVALALFASGEAARNEGRHRDALRSFRELRRVAGPQQLAEEVTTLQFLDRYEHAQLLLDEVRSDSRSATRSVLPALHCAQLWQDFNLGHSDDAESGARTLLELGTELGNGVYALDALIVQIALELLRGQTQSAAARLAFADQLTDTDDDVRRPGLGVMHGWLAASQGDLGKALDVLGPVAAGAVGPTSYWPMWPCWMGLFFEIGAAGKEAGFSDLVVRVAELAASRNPGVASFEGVALSVRGGNTGDLAMLGESVRILQRSPRPILRASGAERYGRALLAAGQREAGVEQLDKAWDDYHRMDARVYRVGVQRVLREAGVRRAKWSAAGPRPSTGWGSLTDAERRVARLIADGRSNRSAAGELGVSVNTVGTHLRVAFSKLGVQSRVQLANAFRLAESAERGSGA